MRKGGVGILGLGGALPPTVRTNAFWADLVPSWRRGAAQRDEDRSRSDFLVIDRQTDGRKKLLAPEILESMEEIGDPIFQGPRARHVISDYEEISDLEAQAGSAAIVDAGLEP